MSGENYVENTWYFTWLRWSQYWRPRRLNYGLPSTRDVKTSVSRVWRGGGVVAASDVPWKDRLLELSRRAGQRNAWRWFTGPRGTIETARHGGPPVSRCASFDRRAPGPATRTHPSSGIFVVYSCRKRGQRQFGLDRSDRHQSEPVPPPAEERLPRAASHTFPWFIGPTAVQRRRSGWCVWTRAAGSTIGQARSVTDGRATQNSPTVGRVGLHDLLLLNDRVLAHISRLPAPRRDGNQ